MVFETGRNALDAAAATTRGIIMKDFGRWFIDQKPQTENSVADEGNELPDGLYMSSGKLFYNCAACDRECKWYGTVADFEDPEAIKLGGCTQWCLP